MTNYCFISVIEILGFFCKAVMRWSMSFPQKLLLFVPPLKQGSKTPSRNHSAQPFFFPEEPKQKIHDSFRI